MDDSRINRSLPSFFGPVLGWEMLRMGRRFEPIFQKFLMGLLALSVIRMQINELQYALNLKNMVTSSYNSPILALNTRNLIIHIQQHSTSDVDVSLAWSE